LVMVHILNFNFFVVQNFCQDQPIQNSEGWLSLEHRGIIFVFLVVLYIVDGAE
jgi:hypothetical protein